MRKIWLLSVFVLTLAAVCVRADGPQTGTIEGTVRSSDGAPLPGTTVVLEGERGTKTATTDAQGSYRFGLVVPGSYKVTATLEGLGSAATSVPLESGQRRTVDLVLQLVTAETISVISEAPLVNKYDVSTTTSMEAAVNEELVFTTRNWQSVVTSLPGVVQNSQSTYFADHRASVNGGSWQELGGFVEGVDTSFSRLGGSSQLFLPTSVIQEVRIESSGYTAEYGRVTGGVTNAVVKSGSNRFHGDFLYIPQSQKWRADYDRTPIPRDDKINNSYEAAVGGPIVRDKAWFFVAYAEQTENILAAAGDGTPVDNSILGHSAVAKINFQPTPQHTVYVMGVDAPNEFNNSTNSNFYDIYAIPHQEFKQELELVSWSWAIGSNVFLEARAATQKADFVRTPLAAKPVDPSAPADTPASNLGAYWDQATGLRRNAIGNGLGYGPLNFPRDQANASVSVFSGEHELKFGVDWQRVSWETENNVPDRYLGRNFDADAPGGFQTPQLKRVFIPSEGLVSTKTRALAGFAQDRFSWGDHWALTAGLRLEDQEQENDVGEKAAGSTDLSPRLAAVYDVRGDGELLIKGTLGRYYHHISQEIVNGEFSRLPNGANAFNEYQWNAATRLYDRFRRQVLPFNDTVITDVKPYYKDEITFGFEWQFSPLWAFKARGIYWDMGDLMWANNQIDDSGNIFRLVANFPEGERKYQGLQLELNRAFRDGWVVRSNYTLGKAEGNLCCRFDDDNDFLDARRVVDPVSGQPLTAINYYGRTDDDRTHILNLSGTRAFTFGRQSFNLGGFLWYRSGQPWGMTVGTNIEAPGGTITTTTRPEPRDAHTLPDQYALNLTGAYKFPIGSTVEGSLRLEFTNVTNEQQAIDINTSTGMTVVTPTSYQKPREFRLVAGIRF